MDSLGSLVLFWLLFELLKTKRILSSFGDSIVGASMPSLGWDVVLGVLKDVVFTMELGVETIIDDDDDTGLLFTKALFTNLISFVVRVVRGGDGKLWGRGSETL